MALILSNMGGGLDLVHPDDSGEFTNASPTTTITATGYKWAIIATHDTTSFSSLITVNLEDGTYELLKTGTIYPTAVSVSNGIITLSIPTQSASYKGVYMLFN